MTEDILLKLHYLTNVVKTEDTTNVFAAYKKYKK